MNHCIEFSMWHCHDNKINYDHVANNVWLQLQSQRKSNMSPSPYLPQKVQSMKCIINFIFLL